MRDDLISRKAAVELVIAEYDRFQSNGGSHSGRHELDKVIKMIQNMPTTFDKGKVIEELKQISEFLCAAVNFNGAACVDQTIEIVKKGGIE